MPSERGHSKSPDEILRSVCTEQSQEVLQRDVMCLFRGRSRVRWDAHSVDGGQRNGLRSRRMSNLVGIYKRQPAAVFVQSYERTDEMKPLQVVLADLFRR